MNTPFKAYLDAGYPILYVQTHEEDRAIQSLSTQIPGYSIFSWDIVSGLIDHQTNQVDDSAKDPAKALTALLAAPETSVLFFKDFHRFTESLEVCRTLKNLIPRYKSSDRHIIMVAPVLKIPVELTKDITTIDFKLPTAAELMATAEQIIQGNEIDVEVDEHAVAAGRGLTLKEAENAYALSLITHQSLNREVIEDEKLQTIKKSGLMELYNPVPLDQLGGLNPLKQYVQNRKRGFDDTSIPSPKGIFIVGPPGSGKSLSAKVIASVLELPLIRLDISALKAGIVGQSEERMRQATTTIDAIAPCVVWLDEIEKAMSGVQSSGKTDGGTTSGMFGHFLTWLQESEVAKYIVATCNDIGDLLQISQGALLRRFDDVFFIDIPTLEEREIILGIMNKRYGTDISKDTVKHMPNWTGAEIEKFVRSSIYDGVDEALTRTIPVYQQNQAVIDKARTWAKKNARLANSVPDLVTRKVRKISVNN